MKQRLNIIVIGCSTGRNPEMSCLDAVQCTNHLVAASLYLWENSGALQNRLSNTTSRTGGSVISLCGFHEPVTASNTEEMFHGYYGGLARFLFLRCFFLSQRV